VVLFPANPEECFYQSVQAFDLAERLQTPVMVLSDLDIGMNDWMCPELQWDDNFQPDRGKVLTKEQIEGLEKFHRYLDKDGDGIPARTLPGVHPKGAYFTRGSGHNQFGGYTEDSTEYQIVVDRLKRKFETAKTLVPKPVFIGRNSQEVGIVSMGSCDGAVREAIDILARQGIHVDYMRVRAFPFGAEVEEFLAAHKTLFVVEQNRDAQLKSLLTLETAVSKSQLHSILYYSGLPMAADCIVEGVSAKLKTATPPLTAVR
jgi:2-oxoglutarate ferredoxin oxidoreductase subunit alpha